MKEGATYNLTGDLSELVGALELTTDETARIMILSTIKQTLEREFGAVLGHDDTQAPNDGWIEWIGGENPATGKMVEVKVLVPTRLSDSLHWTHFPGEENIVSYKVGK